MQAANSKSRISKGQNLTRPLLARDVKHGVDIVAVASSFTRLRRTAAQWVGLCPLPDHGERHPSFYVHPRGVWFCHGCTRGGDVFRLVMHVKGCDFPTSVNFVARFVPCAAPLVRPPKAVERGRRSRPPLIARPSRAEPIPAERADLPPLVCAADVAWEQEQAALLLLL
jgi:CHC2 zinc finger